MALHSSDAKRPGEGNGADNSVWVNDNRFGLPNATAAASAILK